MRDQLQCTELCLGGEEELIEGVVARIKGQANMGDFEVGVYYWPPDHKKKSMRPSANSLK